MNTNTISMNILVDSSSSMSPIASEMADSLNRLVDEKRKSDVFVTYSVFSNVYRPIFADKPIRKIRKFSFEPGGYTALIESACKMIDEVGARLAAMPEHERPGKVMFVIITDGEENASAPEFTRDRLFAKIKEQTEVYNWLFLYLGANQDSIQAAKNYGIAGDQAVDWQATAKGASRNTRRLGRAIERMQDLNSPKDFAFDAEDRTE